MSNKKKEQFEVLDLDNPPRVLPDKKKKPKKRSRKDDIERGIREEEKKRLLEEKAEEDAIVTRTHRIIKGGLGVCHAILFLFVFVVFLAETSDVDWQDRYFLTITFGNEFPKKYYFQAPWFLPFVLLPVAITYILAAALSKPGSGFWYIKAMENKNDWARWVEYGWSHGIILAFTAYIAGILDMMVLMILLGFNIVAQIFYYILDGAVHAIDETDNIRLDTNDDAYKLIPEDESYQLLSIHLRSLPNRPVDFKEKAAPKPRSAVDGYSTRRAKPTKRPKSTTSALPEAGQIKYKEDVIDYVNDDLDNQIQDIRQKIDKVRNDRLSSTNHRINLGLVVIWLGHALIWLFILTSLLTARDSPDNLTMAGEYREFGGVQGEVVMIVSVVFVFMTFILSLQTYWVKTDNKHDYTTIEIWHAVLTSVMRWFLVIAYLIFMINRDELDL